MKKTITLLACTLLVLTIMSYTATGQSLVKDIIPGASPASSNPEQYTDVNGTLFFLVRTGNPYNHQIWKTDGTAANTLKVKDSVAVTNLGNVVKFQAQMNGTLFYTVSTTPATSTELWKTNGTVTTLVTTFNYQSGKGIIPKNFTVVGSQLFFQMAIDNGLELWMSDGTAGGTHEIINLDPGSSAGTQYNGIADAPMIAYKGKIYFAGETSLSNYELYTSDGTAGGTVLVKELAPGTINQGAPTGWTIYKDELYFNASDGKITSLWKTDGVTTTQLTTTVSVAQLIVFKDAVYFQAGIDLWKSDGTVAGTKFVADSIVGSGFSGGNSNYLFTSYARFKPVSPYYDYFYYKTDGTLAGTVLITPKEYGRASFNVVNNKMYKTLLVSGFTTALWSTDGTTADSVKIISGYTGSPYIFKGKVYFSYFQDATGQELWVYDPAGITGITEVKLNDVINIYPNPSSGLFSIKTLGGLYTDYEVYNNIGEKITEEQNTLEIDLSGHPKGIYFVKIKAGSIYYINKVVIQ